MSPAERPALSVAETTDLLGISRWLVQQAVRDGSLPSVRVGRRILIPAVQLDALLGRAARRGTRRRQGRARHGGSARSRAVDGADPVARAGTTRLAGDRCRDLWWRPCARWRWL